MIRHETEEAIEKFLQKVEKDLPDSFETEDLLMDLREHIIEALSNKLEDSTNKDQLEILKEVLEEVGEPEEIAEEFAHARLVKSENDGVLFKRKILIRMTISILISIPSAWLLSSFIDALEFYNTLMVLLVFAVFETIIRVWQMGRDK